MTFRHLRIRRLKSRRLRLSWLQRKRKTKIREQSTTLVNTPEFTWCSDSPETYQWMNRELVELVVYNTLAIPLEKWQKGVLYEKQGYYAVTSKGSVVFLRTHYWKGPGRTGRNEYYIYVDGELIGRFTEVRGDFINYYYGYTGVEYACRHIAYEIYELEIERAKIARIFNELEAKQEEEATEAQIRQQIQDMRRKF